MLESPNLTPDETKRLLDCIDNLEHKTAIQLGFDMGCRVGEIVTIPNIPEFSTVIQILDSKAQNEVKLKGKTKRTPYRQCVITTQTLNLIKMYQDSIKDEKPKRKFLFPYNERTLSRWIKLYCEKAGIKRKRGNLIRWHMLRHTYIQNAIERGVPLKQVSDQTGDSIFTLLRYYSNYTLEARQLVVEKTSITRGAEAFDALHR